MHPNFCEIPNFIPQNSTFKPKITYFSLPKRQFFSILPTFAAKKFVKIVHKKLPPSKGRVFLVFLQRFVEFNIALVGVVAVQGVALALVCNLELHLACLNDINAAGQVTYGHLGCALHIGLRLAHEIAASVVNQDVGEWLEISH